MCALEALGRRAAHHDTAHLALAARALERDTVRGAVRAGREKLAAAAATVAAACEGERDGERDGGRDDGRDDGRDGGCGTLTPEENRHVYSMREPSEPRASAAAAHGGGGGLDSAGCGDGERTAEVASAGGVAHAVGMDIAHVQEVREAGVPTWVLAETVAITAAAAAAGKLASRAGVNDDSTW